MRLGSILVAACVALAIAAPAIGQTPPEASPGIDPATHAAAQALFEEGRALRVEMRWEEALAKFTASHKLDPAVGTLLNIADCHLEIGRTASAWAHYVDAITVARSRGDARREAYARERVAAVEPQLARLRISVPHPPPDLVVTRGGAAVPPGQWSSAVPVDPGMHVVRAAAPGYQPWQVEVDVTNPGRTAELVIPELTAAPVEPNTTPPALAGSAQAPGQDAGDGKRALVGWIATTAGGLAIGVGIAFEVRAHMLDDASDRYCPDSPDRCTPAGADLRDDAHVNERVAIVALGVGGAALGVGVVLLTLEAIDGGKARRSGAVQASHDGVRIRW